MSEPPSSRFLASDLEADERSQRLAIKAAQTECQQLRLELEELACVEKQTRLRMSEINDRSNALNKFIDDQQAVFAGKVVSRLPTELLSEIFLHYCGTDMLDVFSKPKRTLEPRRILSLVCKRWKRSHIRLPGYGPHLSSIFMML
ncbi:hypothetical protein HGRIS_006367 [Hohenbuehelia grisea]|uniref:F-box domain-containing protein n=1 Tax=Hohenbuehelia grisea TaxID=104357 RepID=A0ABR3K2B1_9AGAR